MKIAHLNVSCYQIATQLSAGDHVRKMSGLVVVVVGGGGAGGQNMAEANEGMKVVGCEGVSRLPRQSRHNRNAWTRKQLMNYYAQ